MLYDTNGEDMRILMSINLPQGMMDRFGKLTY